MKESAPKFEIGVTVCNEVGLRAVVLGYTDKGRLDVLRQDGLRVVYCPERCYSVGA